MRTMLRTSILALCLIVATVVSATMSTLHEFWREHFTRLDVQTVRLPMPASGGIYPIDIDGDGNDELLRSEDRLFNVISQDGNDWKFSCWLEDFKFAIPMPAEGEALPYIMCLVQNDSVYEISYVRGADLKRQDSCGTLRHLIYAMRPEIIQHELRGGMGAFAAVDINGDAEKDFLFSVGGGKFTLQPRGVMAVDGRTHRELWHNWFGPLPQTPSLVDLNGDGRKEILVGGGGVDNGSSANGLGDTMSMIFALNLQGQFIFPPVRIDGPLTGCYCSPLPRANGTCDILVASRTAVHGAPSRILILSGTTGKVLQSFSYAESFWGARLVWPTKRGDTAIVASTDQGKLLRFNLSLVPTDSFVFPDQSLSIVFDPFDIDGDSLPEIPVQVAGNAVWFFNSDLDSVYCQRFVDGQQWMPVPIRTTEQGIRKFMVKVGDVPYVQTVRRVDRSFTELIPVRYQMGFAGMIILIVPAMFLVQQRRRTLSVLGAMFNDSSRIVLGLDAKGVVFKANQSAESFFVAVDHLTGRHYKGLRTVPAYAALADRIDQFFAHKGRPHESDIGLMQNGRVHQFLLQIKRLGPGRRGLSAIVIVSLQDITQVSQTKLYESWDAFTKGIAHDLRKQLAPLQLRLQDLGARFDESRVDPATANERFITPALSNLDQMNRLVDRLPFGTEAGELPAESVNLRDALRYVVSARKSTHGTGIDIRLNEDHTEATVTGNRVDLERVFAELIDNAATALDGAGKPTVSVSYTVATDGGQSYVRVEVKDNGRGIPGDLLPRIFEPGFTTGIGDHRGLGLFTVNRIVIQHSGRIQVDSEPGVGTAFAVILPVSNVETHHE